MIIMIYIPSNYTPIKLSIEGANPYKIIIHIIPLTNRKIKEGIQND